MQMGGLVHGAYTKYILLCKWGVWYLEEKR
jgi:hypothetical protein